MEEAPTPGLLGSGERGSEGFYTQERRELLRYFAKRHEHGERMRLLKMDVAEDWKPGTAGGSFTITRRADDLEPGLGGPERVAGGKAAIDCEKQKIYIWNMETEPAERGRFTISPHDGPPCDEPPGWKPGSPAIVGVRKD